MSIEMLILARVEASSHCVSSFTFPAPSSCDAWVQMWSQVAQFHLFTWAIIGFFFMMLFSVSTMVFSGHGGHH